MSSHEARRATRYLIANRAPNATVCPSEVARALAAGIDGAAADWREFMPVVHDAIDTLVRDKEVQLRWKRKPLEGRSGPYRIGRGSGDPR
jgi:hypothetical protein